MSVDEEKVVNHVSPKYTGHMVLLFSIFVPEKLSVLFNELCVEMVTGFR